MIDVKKPVTLKTIFTIALPIVVSQATETIMLFTDRFFLSLLGTYVLIKVLHVRPIVVWFYFIGFVLSLGIAMFLRYKTGNWQKIKMV